jgi:hypothetical protein
LSPNFFFAQEADLFLCLCAIVNLALCLKAVQKLSNIDFWVEAE